MPSPEKDAPPVDDQALRAALEKQDALSLARLATDEQLHRLKQAERVLELGHERAQRTRRAARLASAMVGYVALAGFFANAYQSYSNKKQTEARAKEESERWSKEFKRAQEADKYRAFFETSALVTDPGNADKRLVGYALLKEFVDDESFSSKAIILLEESLALELRGNTSDHGLDDERRLAVGQILTALSQSPDCKVLRQTARTVERLTRRADARPRKPTAAGASAATSQRAEQMTEVFDFYVRHFVGAAALSCHSPKEFDDVRQPIRDLLLRAPAILGATHLSLGEANQAIVSTLRQQCATEPASPSSECSEIGRRYQQLCAEMAKGKDEADERAACALMKEPMPSAPAVPVAPPPDAPPE